MSKKRARGGLTWGNLRKAAKKNKGKPQKPIVRVIEKPPADCYGG